MAENQTYSPYRWVLLATVWLIMVSLAWGQIVISPLAKQLMQDLNIGHAQAMAIFAAPTIVTIFGAMPGGILADRFGYKRMITIAGISAGIFGILRGFAVTYPQFFAFSIVFGIGLAFTSPNLTKLVRGWFPRHQIGTATGLYSTGFAVGMTLALATTHPLFGSNWHVASYATGALVLVVAVIWFILGREVEGKIEEHITIKDLPKVFRHLDTWLCGLILFFILGGLYIFEGQFPVALETARSISPAIAGAATSMIATGLIFGNAFGPMLSDRVGLRKPFVVTCPIIAAITVYLAWALPFGAVTWFLSFSAGLFIGTAVPIAFAILTEHRGISSETLGTAAGFMSSIMSIGMFTLPLIAGYLSDRVPGFNATFIFAAIMLLLVLIFGLLVSETGPKAHVRK